MRGWTLGGTIAEENLLRRSDYTETGCVVRYEEGGGEQGLAEHFILTFFDRFTADKALITKQTEG